MNQPSIYRFSTAEIPESDRLAVFREVFGRGVANMDITPLGEECRAEVELRMFPGTSVMWFSHSAHGFKGRNLSKSDDDCLVKSQPAPASGQGNHGWRGTGRAFLSCADKATVENALPIQHVSLKCLASL